MVFADAISQDLRVITATQLVNQLSEARARTLELMEDLSDEQLMGPQLRIVNPLLWEIGHAAWFQERWTLRHLYHLESVRADADWLYNSAEVPHDTRWDLPLPSRRQTLDYMQKVLERVLERLSRQTLSPEIAYFHLLALYHEDMHTEAFTYSRQTLGYPAPPLYGSKTQRLSLQGGAFPGDVEVPGGTFRLGAFPDSHFVFDNEKWAHAVSVKDFRIARAAVTNAEFAAFVDGGGYLRRDWWSAAGWNWRIQASAEHPVYWQRESGSRWLRRHFDQFVPLEPNLPVVHVNWYEAAAYCRWSGRRLPTEAEWELAASGDPGRPDFKRFYPWGNEAPDSTRGNLDWRSMGCVEVGALDGGDSACGCRQMIGNVWEWTTNDFLPYPGFVVDPYREYSQPWFGTHKVLRGGCWATRSRLIRNTWRNFYTPDRRDVWAGFRTCALDG